MREREAFVPVGKSGAPFDGVLKPGDRLVRSVPCEGIVHSGVVVSRTIETAAELARRGLPVEHGGPGGYIETLETPVRGGPARAMGRRLTDSHGRIPHGQTLVRAAQTGAVDPLSETLTLDDIRRRLNLALAAGGAGLAAIAELGRQNVAGGSDVVREVVAAHFDRAISTIMGGAASILGTQFPNVLAAGPAVLIGLLNAASTPEAFSRLARALLEQAAAANQQASVPTQWAATSGRPSARVAPGTGALGSILTVLVMHFEHAPFFPEMGRQGLARDLARALNQLPANLRPGTLPLGFGLPLPADRVRRLLWECARHATHNEIAKRTLLRMVDEHPYLAPFVLGALAVEALMDGRLPWLKYISRDLTNEADRRALGNLKVHELPAPGTRPEGASYRVKYLIVSDLHRDAERDRRAFGPGDIQHFSKNQALYQRVLDFALGNREAAERYILIENGDAEEFWAIPDLGQAHGDRLREVLDTHADVYRKLKRLHAEGRYYRTQGNHDSALRDPAVFNVMRQWENGWGTRPLENWDFLIIPGVKTMDEFTPLDLLRGSRAPSEFIGLDPGRYAHKKCLVVCHGHQFDFWNCQENELIGRIVTAMFRYPDGWMDRVLPLGGFHMQGNPLFEFEQFFSHDRNLLFNHWLERPSALAKAHHIQHLDNSARQLHDSWLYQETLASLLVSLLMPLSRCGGVPATSLRDRLGHQLLIGHTHYPQSQPFYPIGRIVMSIPGVRAAADSAFELAGSLLSAPLGPLQPLADRLATVSGAELLQRWLDSTVKSRFFNSGVTGWHEGVVYAIEITTEGQARLLYWTDRHAQPQEMDWELAPLSARESARLRADIDGLRQQASQTIRRLRQRIDAALEGMRTRIGTSLEDLLGIFARGMEGLVDAATGQNPVTVRSVLGGTGGAVLRGATAPQQLQIGFAEFLARVAQAVSSPPVQRGGRAGGEETETVSAEGLPVFNIELPLSAGQRSRLNSVRSQIEAGGLLAAQARPQQAAYQVAMVWLFAEEYAPYYGTAHEGPSECVRDIGGSLEDRVNLSAEERAFRALGSLLTWLPIRGEIRSAAGRQGFVLETEVQPGGSGLRIQLRLVRQAPAPALPARQAPQPPAGLLVS